MKKAWLFLADRFDALAPRERLLVFLGLAALLTGCASDAPTSRGEVKGQDFSANELLQSEGNRTAKNAMLANQRSLLLLADKLYRRNPAEWRKSAATREAALAEVEKAMAADTPWPPLAGGSNSVHSPLSISSLV